MKAIPLVEIRLYNRDHGNDEEQYLLAVGNGEALQQQYPGERLEALIINLSLRHLQVNQLRQQWKRPKRDLRTGPGFRAWPLAFLLSFQECRVLQIVRLQLRAPVMASSIDWTYALGFRLSKKFDLGLIS